MEWPEMERKVMDDGHCPADWLSKSTSGPDRWVICMSDGLIQHCLETADRLLEAFALLVKELHAKEHESGDNAA